MCATYGREIRGKNPNGQERFVGKEETVDILADVYHRSAQDNIATRVISFYDAEEPTLYADF